MNLKYPIQSFPFSSSLSKVASKIITPSFNCVDVGSHKGGILKLFASQASQGMHYAIEPIPDLMLLLKKKFRKYDNIQFVEKAIGKHVDHRNFMYVLSKPALSGLEKRPLPKRAQFINILVETTTLDELLPEDYNMDILKIDVCGGEQQVLLGGLNKLSQNRPYILFRHYHKELSCYDSKPDETYQLVTQEMKMDVLTPKQFLSQSGKLSQSAFEDIFWKGDDKYFVAVPK